MGITIAQKDARILRYFQSIVGSGSISTRGSMNQLRFGSKKSREICRYIISFIRLKRDKAITLAQFAGVRGDKAEREKIAKWKVPFKNKNKRLFWPYLAGLVDSDGCIGIYKSKTAGKTYLRPLLNITQANKEFLEGLKMEIGFGSVVLRGKGKTGKQVYNLTFGSKATKELCKFLCLYLHVQKANAERVLRHEYITRFDSAVQRPESQEAAKLYESGIPISEIAKRLNKKPATVNYWLRRKGITRSLSEAQRLRRQREKGVRGSNE